MNNSIHTIESSKFKTIKISIRLIDQLKKCDATFRSLLPFVLRSATKQFNSKKDFSRKLEELYGASIHSVTSKAGNVSLMTFTLTTIDPTCVNDKEFLEEAIKLLYDTIFNPYLVNNAFSKKIVDAEKKILEEDLLSIEDEPQKKAYKEFIEFMFEEEAYSIPVSGYLEEIKNINEKNLYEYYKKCMNENALSIIICGNHSEDIKNIVSKYFKDSRIDANLQIIEEDCINRNTITRVVTKDVSQGILWLGYRSKIFRTSEYFEAMTLCNLMFGVYPQSLLFTNVREKNSLCYSIRSRYDAYKGVVFVSAGISFDKYDVAIKLINEQIDTMINEDLSELLQMTKTSYKNDYMESLDSQSTLVSKAYTEALLNKKVNVEEHFKKIDVITLEDIKHCAKSLQLDSIYFLRGDKVEEN